MNNERTRTRQYRRSRSLKSSTNRQKTYNLVANLAAGGETAEATWKLAKKLERQLRRAKYDCHLAGPKSWREYQTAVSRAARQRPHAVIVFGGDGSVRQAAANVARAKGLLGIVPCGRHNSIFRSLYGHEDQEEALKIIRSEHQIRIDAGLANGQFFVGSLVTGVVKNMIEDLGSKKLPRLAMTWSKWAGKAADETIPRSATIKVDSYTFKAQPLILNIHLLSRLLTLRFAPAAQPEDGRVVLIYDQDGSRDTIAHYIRDLRKNKYQYTGKIHLIRGSRISINPVSDRSWLLDGDEVKFTGESVAIEVLPRVLRVCSNEPAKD